MLVAAFSTIEITAPIAYSTSTSLTVGVTGAINASGFDFLKINDTVGVMVINKSSAAGSYGNNSGSISTVKASGNRTDNTYSLNVSATFTEERQWIKMFFINTSRNDKGVFKGVNTSERIIDIEIDYSILGFGGWNMSFVTADGTKAYCGVNDAHAWSCVG